VNQLLEENINMNSKRISLSGPLAIASHLVAMMALSGASPAQDLRTLLGTFRAYDRPPVDGIVEVNDIRPAAFEPTPGLIPGPTTPLLLVVINPDVLASTSGSYSEMDLIARLKDYHRHLRRDGFTPYFVTADLYDGTVHQDGQTLLALRDVFRSVRAVAPNLQGAVLIGSFPEAMLVRRWVWRKNDAVTINGISYNTSGGPRADWLRIMPELIASRSDIVLADLDGRWDTIYHRALRTSCIAAVPDAGSPTNWPQAGLTLTCTQSRNDTIQYDDCFFIDDACFTISSLPGQPLRIAASPTHRRPEVGGSDINAVNRVARPDIMVSRINPLHVGVRQDSRFLDTHGLPVAVPAPGSPSTSYTRDPAVQRTLLVEYLDRNLAHRVGARKQDALRTARLLSLSDPSRPLSFGPMALGTTVDTDRATTLDLVRFLKTPAVIKSISAHSLWNMSAMTHTAYNMADLDAETGGKYWHWATQGSLLVPTYDTNDTRDALRFELMRTLWANGKLRQTGPAFYVHVGCHVNDVTHPINTAFGKEPSLNVPYSSAQFATHVQLAENLLFYGNGLAVLSRAKEFNDHPRGFADALSAPTARFGDTLREYSRLDSMDAAIATTPASHNRTYFWSILGDWTLRMDHTVTPNEAVATLHTHANFAGPAISLPVGRYDVALLENSIGNDMLSSVTVAPGFRVRLFYHHRFLSEGMVVTASAASLGTMNDQTSSLIVEPANEGPVQLFQHADFQGPSLALDVGAYDVNTLVNTIGNDQLTSLHVPTGYMAFLYYAAGFTGGPLIVNGSISNLGAWNDIVSSLVVVRLR
jgi:hypothetical protein